MEPVRIEQAVHAADQGDADKVGPTSPAKRWAIAGVAAAALAGIARLIGFERIAAAIRSAGPVAKRAAAAVATGAAEAARAVGRVAASPFRAIAIMTGLGLVALAGAGLYDVEWVAGVAFGAIMATAVLFGAKRARKALLPRSVGHPR